MLTLCKQNTVKRDLTINTLTFFTDFKRNKIFALLGIALNSALLLNERMNMISWKKLLQKTFL